MCNMKVFAPDYYSGFRSPPGAYTGIPAARDGEIDVDPEACPAGYPCHGGARWEKLRRCIAPAPEPISFLAGRKGAFS